MSGAFSALEIDHVVPHVHDLASGPAHCVPALCRGLSRVGHSVTLHTLAPGQPDPDGYHQRVYPSWPVLEGLGVSPRMSRALRNHATASDVLHSHGLWMMPNVYPGIVASGGTNRLVISPRGTLDPVALAMSRRRKRIMWSLLQRRALEVADLLHATSEDEAEAIRSAGLTQPVALIPNGVDIPDVGLLETTRPEQIILYLGRLHPQKRIEMLIDAWGELEPRFTTWRLRIVGPTRHPSYVESLRRRVARMALSRVEFAPPAYREDRVREYARAAVLVLPTATESFGMVVAEALAAGTPAIVTKGAPWKGLEEQGCGWWVDDDPQPIRTTLREAMSASQSDLGEMGRRGREWMRRDFGWDQIADRMAVTYRWIVSGGPRPEWVHP